MMVVEHVAHREHFQAVAIAEALGDPPADGIERFPGIERQHDAAHVGHVPTVDEQAAADEHAAPVGDEVRDDARDWQAELAGRCVELDRIADVKIEPIGEPCRDVRCPTRVHAFRGICSIAFSIPSGPQPRWHDEAVTRRTHGDALTSVHDTRQCPNRLDTTDTFYLAKLTRDTFGNRCFKPPPLGCDGAHDQIAAKKTLDIRRRRSGESYAQPMTR